jgi:hypothetical protein
VAGYHYYMAKPEITHNSDSIRSTQSKRGRKKRSKYTENIQTARLAETTRLAMIIKQRRDYASSIGRKRCEYYLSDFDRDRVQAFMEGAKISHCLPVLALRAGSAQVERFADTVAHCVPVTEIPSEAPEAGKPNSASAEVPDSHMEHEIPTPLSAGSATALRPLTPSTVATIEKEPAFQQGISKPSESGVSKIDPAGDPITKGQGNDVPQPQREQTLYSRKRRIKGDDQSMELNLPL